MNPSDRFLARLIGTLFVVTTLMGTADAYVGAPVLQGPVADIHRHAAAVLTGGLMRLLMSIGVIGIALAFLPVVRRYSEITAMTYLAFRTAECVLLSLGVCGHIFLIELSTDAESGNNPSPALAEGALGFTNTTYQMAMTILGIGSTLLCWVLLRSRLIPAWLATLGIVGYLLLLASAVLDLLGLIDTTNGAGGLMYIPGGLFELLLLPTWLWFRGFRTTSDPTTTHGRFGNSTPNAG